MAQISTGIRKILEVPAIYTWLQNVLGAEKSRKEIVTKYLDIKSGMSILDVGCGPGDLLPFLPNAVEYVGFDFENSYIEKARKRFGEQGSFVCEDVTRFDFGEKKFDRVIIIGVLHHLETEQIEILFKKIQNVLNPDGFLLCFENVYVQGQHPIARYMISKDRGQNVRDVDGYLSICRNFFNGVEHFIRHDMLRIPYTHILIKCKN